ncbi:MAG: sensor histidine kinase [Actinobacteria bacterium]|nr:sensor histidine kinase [Actinomycetota bacterium]
MDQVSLIVRRYSFDVLIVIVAIGSSLEVALRYDSFTVPQMSLWFSVLAITLIVLPLLGHRRLPFAAPMFVWLLAAALSFIDGQLISSTSSVILAGMVSGFLLGNLSDAVQARVGLAVTLSGAAIVVYNSPNRAAGQFIFIPLLFAIAWLSGFALRERAEQAEAAEERADQAEREREVAARIAVAEERTRIARELHDVVAHSVSVMVLQVGAVRHRLPQTLEDDREALSGVEQAGRTALAEMRRLLGAMRRESESLELTPQPGLDSIDKLLQDIDRSGLPVRLHVDGEHLPLPRAIDLSAYRIVQEGLTNALRHARASQADVTISYGIGELRLEVRDDGIGGSASDGPGLGLVGVRERVKIYGGEMTAGNAPEGGFVLKASLPFGGDGG